MTQTIGSRRQVWNGTAKRTSGGLTKSDLMMSHGRIVSRSKHFSAKKEMRLLKYGYGTKKGKFGYVKIGTKKHRKGHKKMKGGHFNIHSSLSPDGIDGQGITNYTSFGSVGVQEMAGMAGGGPRLRARSMAGGQAASSIGLMRAGRRHRRSHRMRGGSGMASMSEPGSAIWAGDKTPLERALMAGGRRRSRALAGGTGNRAGPVFASDAAAHNSTDVQIRSGLSS